VTDARRPLRWAWLGRVPYRPTWELQESIRRRIRGEGAPDHLLLLEHDPVYTLGRNADPHDVLADETALASAGFEVVHSNRGGQVTYHGPGQLVGYPIVNLDPDRRDVRRYVRDLQEVLIRTLAGLGVVAERREGKDHIGVWVGEAKIASIGVHIAHWITVHGFALNVETDLAAFGGIVACGLPDVEMTSISRLLGRAPSPHEVARRLVDVFAEVFERSPIEVGAGSLAAAPES